MARPTHYRDHCAWMRQAIHLAAIAGRAGDVPVGAVLVDGQGHCLATAANRRQRDQDPTAHAELLALRIGAQRQQSWHLHQCTLYVTLEPCPMCAGAMVLARLGQLVYGTPDPKTGAIRTVLNVPDGPGSHHRLAVLGGILEQDCRQQLQTWFQQKRGSALQD